MMRPVNIILILALAVYLLQNVAARSSRRCPDCPKHEKARRKGRAENEKRRRPQSLDHVKLSKDPSESPSLRIFSEAQKAKYLEQLAKSHPFLFSKGSLPRVVSKYPTDQYTEAVVDAVVEKDGSPLNVCRVVGKFGYHSRHQAVFGRLVHIADQGRNGSHYGCSEDIANKDVIMADSTPWIAMMARGKCSFLVKIKLAERFNASAVVVYDTETTGEVEVMRTIGTRIPSLMIGQKGGNRLGALASGCLSTHLNITVGAINLQTSKENLPTMSKTKKKVIIDIQTRVENFLPASLHKTIGYFGLNSPQESVSGKLVHIKDVEDEESHFGCSGSILNEVEVSQLEENWVALVARGKCNSVIKVKLAERYAASAVVIYDTNFYEKDETINVIGANVTALSIDMIDGRKALQLLKETNDLYIDIRADSSQGELSGGRGSANSLRPSPFFVITTISVILGANIFCF